MIRAIWTAIRTLPAEDWRRAALLAAITTCAAMIFPAAAMAQALNVNLGSGAGLTERVVQLVGLLTVLSLAGIGMLALTGDTLSMDVFGPVADNANGIGEMGYNRDENNQPLSAGHPDFIPPNEALAARHGARFGRVPRQHKRAVNLVDVGEGALERLAHGWIVLQEQRLCRAPR